METKKSEEIRESKVANESEELIVISDLHLSDGYDETTGKYSRNEDFFFDEEFKRFLEHLQKEPPQKHLIIAGDMFDFLQVDPKGARIEQYLEFVKKSEEDYKKQVSDTGEGKPDVTGGEQKYDLSKDEDRRDITGKEREFGLGTGRAKAIWKLRQIVNGHKVFFEALADFLYEGNRLTIISGNHDVELYWSCITEALKDYIAEQFKDDSITEQELHKKRNSIKEQINYCHWFYYNEDFQTYIEHGNQYDEYNSFNYFLYPHLEHESTTLWLPIGSYFVRYFFNRLETVHPFADNIKPISKYAQWAWSNDKLVLLSVIKKQFFMMFGILRKRREFSKANIEKLDEENNGNLKGLKENKPHFNNIDEIYRLMETPLTSRKLSIFLFFAGTIFFVITVVALVVLILLRIFFKFSFWTFLSPLVFLSVPLIKWVYHKYFQKDFFEKNITKIQKIKDNLKDVRIIVFGHTHSPDIRKVNKDCWYVNTGTWTTVFSEEERIIREAKQFAFVWIKDANKMPELLQWDPSRNKHQRLMLFESK